MKNQNYETWIKNKIEKSVKQVKQLDIIYNKISELTEQSSSMITENMLEEFKTICNELYLIDSEQISLVEYNE